MSFSPASPPITVQIDGVTFLVTSSDFQTGHEAGTRHYAAKYAGRLLVDEQLYEFIMTYICEAYSSNRWKAGFLVGFLDALLKEGRA